MSIGKDVTNRKPKLRTERYADKWEKQQEKQAQQDEEKLEEGQKAKAKKELKYEMPSGNTEAPPNHYGVLVDADEGKVVVAGGKKRRKSS